MERGGAASRAGRFAIEQASLAHDPSYQLDFVAPPRPAPPSTPDWLIAFLRWIAPATPYLFWSALVVGVGFLLFLAGRELLRERGERARPAKVLDIAGLAPTLQRAQAILSEADRLAADGRFGEAVRVLLHRTLDDLADLRPGLISPAQTAREITQLEVLAPAVREPLARIAAAVERFLFAGRSLDRTAFESCRAEYDRFVAAAGRA